MICCRNQQVNFINSMLFAGSCSLFNQSFLWHCTYCLNSSCIYDNYCPYFFWPEVCALLSFNLAYVVLCFQTFEYTSTFYLQVYDLVYQIIFQSIFPPLCFLIMLLMFYCCLVTMRIAEDEEEDLITLTLQFSSVQVIYFGKFLFSNEALLGSF